MIFIMKNYLHRRETIILGVDCDLAASQLRRARAQALTLEKVVQSSDAKRFFYDNGFRIATDLVHSHPEPAVFEVGDE